MHNPNKVDPKKVTNAFESMSSPLKDIFYIIKHGTRRLESHISNKTWSELQKAIRLQSYFNLIDYDRTGSEPRDKTIDEAFDLLEKLVGFKYNKSGSFTPDGANETLDEDLKFSQSQNRLEVIVSGRLEEMENGDVNWNNMRRFFYNFATKQALLYLLPDSAPDFYDRLDKLFKETKDPTMPEGRPYISKALEGSLEYLEESIEYGIEQAFEAFGKGKWTE